MIKKMLLVFIILSSIKGFSQENSSLFIENSLNGLYDGYREIHKENTITKYNNIDFSHLWLQTESKHIFGFIGKNYQRLQIKFISIIKDSSDNQSYRVFGKSKVNQNVCDFQGTIRIMEIHLVDHSEFPDNNCGMIVYDFEFFENPKQSHVGVFKGKGVSYWYQDSENQIKYDDLLKGADGFSNNQFVGNWIEYGKSNSKICNWGDYRIPMSGEFGQGAGEFVPNKKYKVYGWENFLDAYFYGDNEKREKAQKIENQAWWK